MRQDQSALYVQGQVLGYELCVRVCVWFIPLPLHGCAYLTLAALLFLPG